VLSRTRSSGGRLSQTKNSPEKPGRFTTHILPTSNLSLQADVEIVEHATILAIQAAGLTHYIFAMFQA